MGGPMLPEMMRWLWRDHRVSTDPNDTVERTFNTPKKKVAPPRSRRPGPDAGNTRLYRTCCCGVVVQDREVVGEDSSDRPTSVPVPNSRGEGTGG